MDKELSTSTDEEMEPVPVYELVMIDMQNGVSKEQIFKSYNLDEIKYYSILKILKDSIGIDFLKSYNNYILNNLDPEL